MTTIRWTGRTWNPLVGCTKVSSGCANCYAVRMASRMAEHPNPKIRAAYQGTVIRHANGKWDWSGKVNLIDDRISEPSHWRKPTMVFVNSMSDLFHESVDGRFINEIWMQMFNNPRHVFQVLTKRPDRLLWWTETAARAKAWPIEDIWPEWIWIGTSVESQQVIERVDVLTRVPAKVRFLSCEPLLGEIDLSPWLQRYDEIPCPCPCHHSRGWMVHVMACCQNGMVRMPRFKHDLHWVICGGESGPGYRPMNLDHARSLRDQCVEAGVPFFFKQTGGPAAETGQELDGVRWEQYPRIDHPLLRSAS